MAPAVEIIGKTESEAPTEIAFYGDVGLLRIGVDEVLGLRIAEGLESEREKGSVARVQIVLVEEDRLREIQSLELLLVRQVAKVCVCLGIGRRRTSGQSLQSLKDWNCIQIGRIPGAVAGRRARKSQLSAGRTVGSIAEKIEAQQRVIVKHSVRSAHNGLAIACGIPRDADPRLKIVLIGLNPFLQSQQFIGGKRQSLRRPEFRRNFYVIAHAIIQSDRRTDTPRVLPERS